jgi:adenylate cyclase
MAQEIERKFLVDVTQWSPNPAGGVRYRQGYLATDPDRVVRVRIAGTKAFLTIKGRTAGITRLEFEYPIPREDAGVILDSLCLLPLVEKTRYREPFGGHVFEVDVFEGANAGLVLAEVELPSADTKVALPPWVGREVSDDARYFNSNLIRNPYSGWAHDG